jgi:hypothetical protein
MPNKLIAAGSGSNPEITNPVLGSLGDKTGPTFFQGFIPGLIGLAFVAGTIIFFFVLILGAIQWIAAGGDKQALEGARSKITNAIIGIIILFSLFAVLDLIHVFFGVTIMTLDIGPLVIQ